MTPLQKLSTEAYVLLVDMHVAKVAAVREELAVLQLMTEQLREEGERRQATAQVQGLLARVAAGP